MQEPPFDAQDDLYVGTDYESEVWTWYANGTPVDLTGCTAAIDFRVAPDDAAAQFAGVVALGGPLGTVSFTVARASSAACTAVIVHGDLLLTDSLGKVRQFAHVDLNVHPGNTH